MWNSKVVWHEGMFLLPQHFQQQDRYFEALLEGRCAPLLPSPWGLSALKFDEPQLRNGKIGLTQIRGVFPDGTPFNLPHDSSCPESIPIPEHIRDQIVFITIPTRSPGMGEVADGTSPTSMARFAIHDPPVPDSVSPGKPEKKLKLAQPRLRLALESEQLGAYECIGLARIDRVEANKHIVFDESYIPPVLDANVSSWLNAVVREIYGSLRSRGDALAAITGGANRATIAQNADILLLQTINRYEPLFSHLASTCPVHPESLYRTCLMLAGELATFRERKRCREFEAYRHEDLSQTFNPVIDDIRRSLAEEGVGRAIVFAVEKRKYGFWTARVDDRVLLKTASFIIGVNSTIAPELMRHRFPSVVQVGPTEQIGHLADHSLPGIRLQPVGSLPPGLPYHEGKTYFSLDRSDALWKALDTSGAIALHVAEEFPELALELWAIRE